ncbi:concanavalin A-like lectin/glucanase domain-containing protein [Aspergillus karnatakaensis]|uniref:glycoside hydrolase family 16 protein n=1 Tax=Aspergillus karnatakaensis TaxID=1810916 RepID=UPI003CCE2996
MISPLKASILLAAAVTARSHCKAHTQHPAPTSASISVIPTSTPVIPSSSAIPTPSSTPIRNPSYAHRIFHDFRNLDDTGSLYNGEPAQIETDEESSSATVQEGYLTSSAFTNDFRIQTWGSPVTGDTPIRKEYSNGNVYIRETPSASPVHRGHQRDEETSQTHLVLRAHRNADFVSSGEIDTTVSNIFHASITVRARVRGDAGTCAGIFTYFDDNNESDIEILTRDPTNHIRYTNQPGLDADGNEIPEASSDVELLNGAVWTEWHDHRIDWTPELSAWYLDGEVATTKTYGIPQEPSTVIINMWGDGGLWTGDIAVGAAAYLEIQWIEILYNTA